MDPLSRSRRSRPLRNAGLLIGMLAGLLAGQGEQNVEYQVKAAFLLNFTRFVQWPAGSFATPQSPLTICVMGKDPFGRALDDVVRGETANSRALAVERIAKTPAPGMCQVVFIGAGVSDLPRVLNALGRGVLTVGEGEKFLRDGGMIALLLDNRRVRFDVDQAAAAAAGLSLSSRLLSVARMVKK